MNLINIKGIGEVTKEKLKELNINTVEDLCLYLPVSYVDLSRYSDLKEISEGSYYLFKGKLIKLNAIKRGRKISSFKAAASVNNIKVEMIWFNQPYMYDKLTLNLEYTFFSKVSIDNGKILFVNPVFEEAGKEVKLKGIMPIYRTGGIIHQGNLRKFILEATEKLKLPSILEGNKDILNYNEAIKMVHMPNTISEGKEAEKRIITEEIVNLIISYKILNSKFSVNKQRNLKDCDIRNLLNKLPFQLTPSQDIAVSEIIGDLKKNKPMNRLLSGDVGSGKTVIAMIASYITAKNGYQAAVIAPTTILAEQHYKNFKLLKELNLNVKLLTGDTAENEKKQLLSDIKKGDCNIVIGTHSLMSEGVEFRNLGLLVTDEMHRFGVEQKNAAENKGFAVDTLVMSATPIPRALALTLYQDLKVSYIEKRNGDLINTSIVPPEKYNDMYGFLAQEIAKGRQAYIVCPRIEDIEGIELVSVKKLYDGLIKGCLKGIKTGLLFGGMKQEEKSQVMKDFKDGKIKVLISTTVIEVGIDVPNATVMIIMNAERFGLAALHQLRGRVGRGGYKSYCLLCSDDRDNPRLNALKKYSDGFKIAEEDFDIRGAGDFIGTRQSGRGAGRFSEKITRELILEGKKIADNIVIDDELKNKLNLIKNTEREELVKKVTMN